MAKSLLQKILEKQSRIQREVQEMDQHVQELAMLVRREPDAQSRFRRDLRTLGSLRQMCSDLRFQRLAADLEESPQDFEEAGQALHELLEQVRLALVFLEDLLVQEEDQEQSLEEALQRELGFMQEVVSMTSNHSSMLLQDWLLRQDQEDQIQRRRDVAALDKQYRELKRLEKASRDLKRLEKASRTTGEA